MKKIAVALIGLAFATSALADEFQVVVHAGNPVTTIKRPLLRDYFLGRATRWADGSAVKPVDLPASSAVRAAFSQQVLGKDVAAVKSHWNTMVFSGRGTPPVEYQSEQLALAAIRAAPAALGYVSASASLGPGLKSIVVVDR